MARECDTVNFFERISIRGIRTRQLLGRWARALLLPGAIVVSAVAVTYAICQLLRVEEVPSKHAWDGSKPLGAVLWVSGVAALVGTLLVFTGYGRALRKLNQNDELSEACKGIWHLAVKTLGIDMTQVGAHVWTVKGPVGFQYLARRATFVVEPRRQTNVTWRKNKGAIGIAWAEDDPIIANVAHLLKRGTSKRLFCAIPRRDRFGLGYGEFARARHYLAILAVPLRVRGRVKGCISVDVRLDGYADLLDTLVKDDQFNRVVAVCEVVLRRRR
jgi:hypothetical protein